VIAALFVRGSGWADGKPIVEQAGFAGHLDWVHEYRDRDGGPIIHAGPFHDPGQPFTDELVGMALLDVASIEAARIVVDLDPIVQSGAFAYRLYEWGGEPLRR
jgi:uncharacterized protein YciI